MAIRKPQQIAQQRWFLIIASGFVLVFVFAMLGSEKRRNAGPSPSGWRFRAGSGKRGVEPTVTKREQID